VFLTLVLFVLVPPIPILPLFFVLEVFIIDIGSVTFVQPAPVGFVLAIVPVVIVLVIGIVHAPFLTLVPLVIPVVLRRQSL
jgi:hypothetical protein